MQNEIGTVYFKDGHQYRSQLRFPVEDGAYRLVRIDKPDKTHSLWVASQQETDGFQSLRDAIERAERAERRTVTYVCPVCAASLERQE